jgi:murein DD-endopeptidase MepM/ murein hydrolase activator NlpD
MLLRISSLATFFAVAHHGLSDGNQENTVSALQTQQGVSRFQHAPKVNFFLQPHMMTLPKLDGATALQTRPLLKVWNLLFMGFMASSAFGLYAHASVKDVALTPSSADPSAHNLPSHQQVLNSKPKDTTHPLKPLVETTKGLAITEMSGPVTSSVSTTVVTSQPALSLAAVSHSAAPAPSSAAQLDLKQLLSQPIHSKVASPLTPLAISGNNLLASTDLPSATQRNDFEINEAGLSPAPQSNRPHATKPGKKHGHTHLGANPDADPDGDEETDEDNLLLNKILAKPRISGLGRPQFVPQRPVVEVDAPNSRFGEASTLGSHVPMTSPLRQLTVSSRFGWRHGRMHQGIDFSAPTGTDILSVGPGVVTYSGWQSGYGKTVIIDHGNGKQTRYAHCHRLFVTEGQRVGQSERIALVGNTGHSTGSHLHFEVLVNGAARNPEAFLSSY